nr:hypothetical protein [Tanacetum cinerariifolium]
MIADAIQQERENLRAEITLQINNTITNHIPSRVDLSVRNYMSGYILHVHPTQASQASNTSCRPSTIRSRDQDDPHNDAHHEAENSAKRQKTSEHGTYVFGESSSGQDNKSEPGPSTSDYKNLNKNDFEDMYLLIVNDKVDDYIETELMWSLSVFIRRIKKHKMLSIIFELVYGIIYKNEKKEKRVTRHQETHRFCDATLKKVLEGLKSYKNNVKQGYVTPSISKEDAENLQLSKEEIEEPLKHRDQMRRWEMYVNERPLGSRRERLE